MKKTMLVLILGIIMLYTVSCFSAHREIKQSKVLKQVEQLINDGVNGANKANNCDELDMVIISYVFGLMVVPGIDSITPAEEKELEEMMKKMTDTFAHKKALLGCKDDEE